MIIVEIFERGSAPRGLADLGGGTPLSSRRRFRLTLRWMGQDSNRRFLLQPRRSLRRNGNTVRAENGRRESFVQIGATEGFESARLSPPRKVTYFEPVPAAPCAQYHHRRWKDCRALPLNRHQVAPDGRPRASLRRGRYRQLAREAERRRKLQPAPPNPAPPRKVTYFEPVPAAPCAQYHHRRWKDCRALPLNRHQVAPDGR
jgi:hypothetical protein